MEFQRRVARPPITRAVKPELKAAKRQPLVGIGNRNIIANVSNKPGLKEKNEITKPILKKAPSIAKVNSIPEKVEKENIHDVIDFAALAIDSLPEGVEDIDKEDACNPQLASPFVNDIYHYLRILEKKYPIHKDFLSIQLEITKKMRAVLFDWLVQVHYKFHLLQETLFLTTSIIDRFLQIENIERSKLQLVGVTAMFIASKYEEMYSPEIGDFVYVCNKAYSKADVLKMEQVILRRLNFCLGKPLPLHFLRRNSKAGNVDSSIHTLGKYLLELLLLEYNVAHYSPSKMAAAALYLSIKLLGDDEEEGNNAWAPTLAYYSTYSEEDVLPLVQFICKVLVASGASKLQAIVQKYASKKLMCISMLPELDSPFVKTLASRCKI